MSPSLRRRAADALLLAVLLAPPSGEAAGDPAAVLWSELRLGHASRLGPVWLTASGRAEWIPSSESGPLALDTADRAHRRSPCESLPTGFA